MIDNSTPTYLGEISLEGDGSIQYPLSLKQDPTVDRWLRHSTIAISSACRMIHSEKKNFRNEGKLWLKYGPMHYKAVICGMWGTLHVLPVCTVPRGREGHVLVVASRPYNVDSSSLTVAAITVYIPLLARRGICFCDLHEHKRSILHTSPSRNVRSHFVDSPDSAVSHWGNTVLYGFTCTYPRAIVYIYSSGSPPFGAYLPPTVWIALDLPPVAIWLLLMIGQISLKPLSLSAWRPAPGGVNSFRSYFFI